MLKKLLILLFALLVASHSSAQKKKEKSEQSKSCKDVSFQLVDDADGYESSVVNLVMDCHDAQGSWPETTTINIFSFNETQGVCSATISCGNLKAWMVDFQVGGLWEYGSLEDFARFNSADQLTGEGVKSVVQINRKNIDRYCSETTKRVCI